jgi:7-cyano-7-deazaguanine synthase
MPPTGLLLSGGIDSCVLLAELVRQGHAVQPFYIHTDLVWAEEELAGLRRFLAATNLPGVANPVIFRVPLGDLYADHWSISGVDPPAADSPDEAVWLPGRNALLSLKPLLWCQAHGIAELALATLANNPFADATPEFFAQFAALVAGESAVRVTLPFSHLHKDDVLQLGRDLPLSLTFSCLAPDRGRHCGQCNKCGERRAAFRRTGLPDATLYAHD